MLDSDRRPETPGTTSSPPSALAAVLLQAAGLAYLALGAVLAVGFVFGGMQSSLFPTGWIFPAVLLLSGALMLARRRFDVVAVVWAGLGLAVFMLGVLIYVNALDRGLDDASAFDATIIVIALGLLPLLLRHGFRGGSGVPP